MGWLTQPYYDRDKAEGHAEGLVEGRTKGRIDGEATLLIRVLQKHFGRARVPAANHLRL
jgi:hypothetical protein